MHHRFIVMGPINGLFAAVAELQRRASFETESGGLDGAVHSRDDHLLAGHSYEYTLSQDSTIRHGFLKSQYRRDSHSGYSGDYSSQGMNSSGEKNDSYQGYCFQNPGKKKCQHSPSDATSQPATGTSEDSQQTNTDATTAPPSGTGEEQGTAQISTSNLSSSTSDPPLSTPAAASSTSSELVTTAAVSTSNESSTTPTTSSSSQGEANVSLPAVTSSADSKSSNKTAAIIGGVIGGGVFLALLILGTILFLRRRRRKRTPASAEFRDRYVPRSTAPPLLLPLAAQTSREDLDELDGPPPPFTHGEFNDSLFEKIRET